MTEVRPSKKKTHSSQKKPRTTDTDLSRFNMHRLADDKVAIETAANIDSILSEQEKQNSKSSSGAQKPKFEITESKKVITDSVSASSVQIGKLHMKRTEELIPLPQRPPKPIFTVSKDPKILIKRLEERKEEEKKRSSERISSVIHENPSKKPRPTFDSFPGIKSIDDLFDNNLKYFSGVVKRNPKIKFSRVPRNVSARHIQNVLWQRYHEGIQVCCSEKTGTCQSLSSKLRHPLNRSAACMAYMSEVQYNAFVNDEKVGTLESESDRFYANYLCVFCYRYNLSRIISDDSTTRGSSINTDDIADYYHITGVVGEYRQDVCFQPQGGVLRGINGPVVMYHPETFVPVVGIISKTNPRVIDTILDMVDYERRREELEGQALAYGWSERGVFFKQNNNTVPECTEINPYVYTYARIKDGPLSARLVLKGYFASWTYTQAYVLFDEFTSMLASFKTIWKKPHPLSTYQKLQKREQNKQYINPNATIPWEKYHLWEHVCIHEAQKPPPVEKCKIYYTFLYILNGIIELQQDSHSYPEGIRKKLRRYIEAFSKFQLYYRECGGDFTDARIKSKRVIDEDLELECSSYFSCQPRPQKLGFAAHEYQYLEFEKVSLKVQPPDVELLNIYSRYKKPHPSKVLTRQSQIETLLANVKKASPGCYHNATVFYNNIVSILREPEKLFKWCRKNSTEWPKNLLAQSVHAKSTESKKKADQGVAAKEMAETMLKILEKVFQLFKNENRQYKSYRGIISLATAPFLDATERISQMLQKGGPAEVFSTLNTKDLSYLLPDGYIADKSGINFIPWTGNTILLTALARVHILERLLCLESPENERTRYLLTLLRNSHIPLVNVITELPPDTPFKRNDPWLRYVSIMPECGFFTQDSAKYRPSLSYLDAYTPYPSLVFHQGRLPFLATAITQTNYFFDAGQGVFTSFLHPVFKHKSSVTPCGGKKFKNIFSNNPVRHCVKTTIGKLSKKKNIPAMIDTVDFGTIVPKRFFIMMLLKCSFLGLYEHSTVRPSFKISTQLLSLFDNGDTQDIRELLDDFTTNFTTVGDRRKKLKFEKILNDIILEYLNYLHRDTAIQHTLKNIYGLDPTDRAVISMDYVRLALAQGTADLGTLYELRQRNPVRLTQKIINNYSKSAVDRFCEVILASDIPRYASANRQFAHIPKQFQITANEMVIVHSFIDKLSPTGTIYAENLAYAGLTENTIAALKQINMIFSRLSYSIEEAVEIYESTDIRQSSIVAYFFNALQNYLRYGELISMDKGFVEAQEKALKKVAGIPKGETDYELPKSIYQTAVCPACNMWNGVGASSQYWTKEFTAAKQTHFLIPHGNQSVSMDMLSGELYCKLSRKSGKKKQGNARNPTANPNDNDGNLNTVTSGYIKRKEQQGNEPTRLTNVRLAERRTSSCGKIPLILANLRNGRILTINQKVKHPYDKRKTTQYKKNIEDMTNDPICLYPALKSRPLRVSNPPYAVSPCCGAVRGTGPHCWGVNGYFCGACLPRSNIEMGITGEILCSRCRQVVANTGGYRCPIPSCISNMVLSIDSLAKKTDLRCTHGASPVYIVDDSAGKPTYAYFCDSCYKDFEICEPGLVSVSAVIEKDSLTAINMLEGKDFSTEKKKPNAY